MIEKANSGHPGIALSAAPILYTLYAKNMNVVPSDPTNIYRDRFVMSAGHGSSILYAQNGIGNCIGI
jgi:transketolase